MTDKTVKIGLLGCGTVGTGLVELINKNRALVRERSGVDLKITKVLVRDLAKPRPGVDRALLTNDPDEVLKNGCDLVVELIGGLDPAGRFISEAIESKKSVVTANKALLAQTGTDLFRAAANRGVRLGFEASVCGGIPIIRALQSGLVGNHIGELTGILNGTCNYILTQMAEQGWTFAQALKEAQAKGFAEADPSLDIDGHDAAQKIEILAELAFGVKVAPGAVRVEGIRHVSDEDIRTAKELGFVLKHIAIARDLGDTLDVRVHPALLPAYHPLATVRHENNAVLVKGDAVGEMLFYGKGAGAAPTASAVLSDIIDIAVNDRHLHVPDSPDKPVSADPRSKYYLRFPILDVPGVIGLIATALGNRGVSISHASATLVKDKLGCGNVKILAHSCPESALRKSIEEISRLPVLNGKPVVLRILEETT